MSGEILHRIAENAETFLSLGGFVIGLVFGAIVMLSNFCTLGAIADIVISKDYRRFRSWVLAAGVALAGAQALDAAGIVTLSQSMYLRGGINWVGSLFGGLIFGIGMALASGCPSRGIVRAGSGDLRALTTLLIMGLCAYVAMGGLLGPLRQLVEANTAVPMAAGYTPALPDLVAPLMGLRTDGRLHMVFAVLLAAAAIIYCLADPTFRRSPRHILGGFAIGACAVAGWVVTTLAHDEFALVQKPPSSISFVRPVADSIDYLARYTAIDDMAFGVALVAGSLCGALIVAVITGRFRIAGFAGRADTAHNLAGAALMGVGGVMALGCSIGQGVTGISTMAAGSFLAFGAMAMGAVVGLKYLESRA